MKLIKLKCESCGAELELNPDHLQAYCQFCGSKLLIDMDNLSEVLKEKEKTKRVVGKEEQVTKRKVETEEHITKRTEMHYNDKKDARKSELIETGMIFGMPLLILLAPIILIIAVIIILFAMGLIRLILPYVIIAGLAYFGFYLYQKTKK